MRRPLVPVLSALLAAPLAAQTPRFDVVPLPRQMTPLEGVFAFTPATPLVVQGAPAQALTHLARTAQAIVAERTGRAPALGRRRTGPALILRLADLRADSATPEGYRLLVTPDSIVVHGPSSAGVFYGLQTLRQLLRENGTVPAVRIEDRPRFAWRGMHLDVGRHFFPLDYLKRYVDLLARFKLNTFHWHLTEDQGWRLEIMRYPRLTEVGAWRRETVVGKQSDPYVGDGRRYGGFYTQAEVRELVRYAAERHVTVVPEIEMPGHALAALAAYPELACTPGPFEVATRWGVFEDVFCPTETTFTFLEHVLREVMALFPSRYIHIGGDEVPKRRWRESAEAQGIMQREGLRSEEELQSWFIRRLERFLSANGRRLIGWDEILEGGLAPGATVMSWRGIAGGLEAARAGHDVVMTPTSHLYFDYYQGDPRFEPLAIGGFLALERVYAFEPVPDSLPPERHRHILGAQGNVWTEYLPTASQVEYMALPRLLALAEVVWSPRESRDLADFLARLPARFADLDRLGVNWRVPHVTGLETDRLALVDTATVTLGGAFAGADIRFTTDGTEPGPGSRRYSEPFSVAARDTGTVVSARLVTSAGRAGPVRSARYTLATLRAAEVIAPERVAPGLVASYLEGAVSRVAGLDSLRPEFTVVVPDAAIPGFARAERFGVRLTGWVDVPDDGIWRFRVTADDGAVLWIGGARVVDNDGLHGPEERSGEIALRRGLHRFELAYFQAGGGRALTVTMERQDGSGRRPVQGRLLRPR
jgi:hexosaminidase